MKEQQANEGSGKKKFSIFGNTKGAKAYTGQIVGSENIRSGASFIKYAAARTMSPRHMIENSRKETFEDAMKRHGTTENELIRIRKNFKILFYLFLMVSIVGLGTSAHFIMLGKFFQTILFISIFSFGGAKAFQYSFRTYQIKIRKLCSAKEFIKSRDYLP